MQLFCGPLCVDTRTKDPAVTGAPLPASPKAAPKKLEDPPADFTGSWVLTSVEGDNDAFMTAFGFGWLKRSAAKAAGYGVGKIKAECWHRGKLEFTNDTKGPQGPRTVVFKMDGSEIPGEPEGRKVINKSVWEGQTIATTQTHVDSGMVVIIKRYMRGENMIVEMVTGEIKVVRIFTRQ